MEDGCHTSRIEKEESACLLEIYFNLCNSLSSSLMGNREHNSEADQLSRQAYEEYCTENGINQNIAMITFQVNDLYLQRIRE